MWRDEQGLAMTEGVIVIPFLLIVWAGMAALTSYFGAAMAASNEAARLTMADAVSGGCNKGTMDASDLDGSATLTEAENKSSFPLWSKMASASPMVVAHSGATVTSQAEGMGKKMSVKASRLMLCNTVKQDGFMDHMKTVVKTQLGL